MLDNGGNTAGSGSVLLAAAAFTSGAAVGAAAMFYYNKKRSEQQVQTIALSALSGLPQPQRHPSAAMSDTASISSYAMDSLPPTPRLSRASSSAGGGVNGISRQASRSSSGGDAG